MKRLLLVFPVFVLMASCEVIVVEEPVPTHDMRNHYIGFYDVEEYDKTDGTYSEYSFNIVKSANYPYTIFIRNFYGVGLEVMAEIEGYDLYIPEQVVNGYHIEGNGFLDGNELVLNFSMHDHLNSHSHLHYYEVVAWR
ncbi:MAG: hypothetical protein ABJH05_07630 [Fulvivirga sp.]